MERILDVTCGDRSIWFDKKESHTVYCDKREIDVVNEIGNNIKAERGIHIHPDIIADFTDLPFKDETFNLVVADPPHLKDASETAWLTKKYGSLHDGWEEMLHDGFQEWMRVLKYGGVLIFKWSEIHIPAEEVWKAIGQKPLFGHHSGKKMNTYWACFMKFEEKN